MNLQATTPLRFTLPARQARIPLIVAAGLLLVGIVAGAAGSTPAGIGFGGCGVFLVVIYFLVMYGSYSELDERGIQSKRGVFRNEVAWADVRDVKPDPKSGQVLLVYRREGKPFKLGAPISGGGSVDPDYGSKAGQIVEFAQAHIPGPSSPSRR